MASLVRAVGRNSAAYCAERKPQPRSPFGCGIPFHHRAGAVCEIGRARQAERLLSHAAQYADRYCALRGLVFLAICTPRFTPEVYQDIDPAPFSPLLADQSLSMNSEGAFSSGGDGM